MSMTKTKPTTWVQRGQWLIVGLAVVGLLWVLSLSFFKPPLPPALAHSRALPEGCPQALAGTAGRHTDLKTAGGLNFTVVTPSNYESTKQHGLLMMYPPAGFSNAGAERYYQLTTQANSQGYVVVYSAAIPLSDRALRLQSEVVPQVLATWCIDPQRVVSAGHSDGGSLTTGLTVRSMVMPEPQNIVVSAAGITLEDLQLEQCPAPLNVTVLHSPKDNLFPDYGAGAVKWWGQCMQCEVPLQESSGCEVRRCAQGKVLRHCVTPEPHVKFPAVAARMFEWID